jgi:GTP-binding protein EngB required for normal cell division
VTTDRPVPSVLSADLATLADLAAGLDRDDVAELRRRLDHGVFRVLVAGEAKRGKSTLVNALLGRVVLPAGVVPLTAIATTVGYGDADGAHVGYLNGRLEERGLDALDELVTEEGNPNNRRGVATVTVRLPAPLLAKGLELVDTPGTGSVHEHNTEAAISELGRMDAAIFVVSADPPISANERAFLRQLHAGAVALFCVLNKVDYLAVAEVAQARRFTERVLAAELGHEVAVWPISARQALAARQRGDETAVEATGLAAFEAAFTSYLAERQDVDLVRSIAGRAARVASGVAEEAAATLAGLALSADDLEQRLAALTDRLEQVEPGRRESAALVVGELDRLLAETNEQGATLTATATPPLRRAVIDHMGGLQGRLDEVERKALDSAADRIRHLVDGWRKRRSAELDAAVRALDERLARRLDQHIALVRRTAATLFDLELVDLPPVVRLVGSTRFTYAFAAEPGQAEAVAAAVRTHLPGALGRRRAAGHVAERTEVLLDQQVGRARADFQDRLAETRRLLLRDLDRRFETGAGRIAEAVGHATALQHQRGEAAAVSRRELQQRRAAAATLAEQLTRYTTPGDARSRD